MARIVSFGIVTAIALFCLAGCGSKDLGGKELDTEKIAVTFNQEVARGGYKVVPTAELQNWMDQKKPMLIIDTMPFESSYKKNHIPGAAQFELPIPEVTSLEEAKKAEFAKLLGPDQDRLLVFYCGFTKCTRSHNGAMWAVKLGYRNVYRQPGGIKAWMEAGYPVAQAK